MDAVDQIVNFAFKGGELAFRISGAAAKNLAVLIAALMKDSQRTSGKTRLARFYREGKDQKVITIPKDKLQNFHELAKKYGVLYCVINDKKAADGLDLVVKAEDAAKINRIYERLGWGKVQTVADIDVVKDPKEIEKAGSIIKIEEPDLTQSEREIVELEYKKDDLEEATGTYFMHKEMLSEVEREPDRFPQAEIADIRKQVEKAEAMLQEKFGLDREGAKKEIERLDLRIETLRKEDRTKNPTKEPDRSSIGSNGSEHRGNENNERVSVKKRLDDASEKLKQTKKAPRQRTRSMDKVKEN